MLEKELREFYETRTLAELEQILTLKDEKIVEYVWQYFSYYVANRKNKSDRDAYCLRDGERVLLYFYDCRLFRHSGYEKEDNELMSAFLLGCRNHAA